MPTLNGVTTPESVAAPIVHEDLAKLARQLLLRDTMPFTTAAERQVFFDGLGVSPPDGAVSYLYSTRSREVYRAAVAAWLPFTDPLAGRLSTAVGFNPINVSTVDTDIAKLAIQNYPIVAGDWYLLQVSLSGNASAAGASYFVRIRKDAAAPGGTIIADWPWLSVAAGGDDFKHFTRPWQAPASETAAKFFVSILRVAGTGDIDIYGDSKSAFWIDQHGPAVGRWSSVP